jgi:transposase
MRRHRQADCNLAVVLLAQLTAILSCHTNRVAAFLGEPRVVDNPGLDRLVTGDRWQNTFAHTPQHRLIRPWRLRHKVQQRLVLRRGSLRRGHRRQRFDALAALRRQQSNTIVRERPHPVGGAQHRCQFCCVLFEPRLRASPIVKIHPTPPRTV